MSLVFLLVGIAMIILGALLMRFPVLGIYSLAGGILIPIGIFVIGFGVILLLGG